MQRIDRFLNRLKKGEKIIFNGPLGTELQRRGINTKLPLWSAAALLTHPEMVREIHEEYIKVGSDILVTDSFRTNRRTLDKVGLGDLADKLTILSAELCIQARKNCNNDDVLVAGDITTLEDCYSPNLTPDEVCLKREHLEWAKALAKGEVDYIQIETVGTIREAKTAALAAKEVGLPFAVSFVCNEKGDLLSGESLEAAVLEITPLGPIFFGTNCRPPHIIDPSVDKLLKLTDLPIAVYANGVGLPADDFGWKFSDKGSSVAAYLDYVKKWLEMGVSIVGSCCGAGPEYIREIKKIIK